MAPNTTRASGEEQVTEIAKDEGERLDETIDTDIAELPDEGLDRIPAFRRGNSGFTRMRMDWHGDDAIMLNSVQEAIEDRLVLTFRDAYEVMNDLFEVVRMPEVDANGEPVVDRYGYRKWRRLPNGNWDEDWTRLTLKQRENFLFQITTRLFDWEQRAAAAWTEAMFSKAQWEERFSAGYLEPPATPQSGSTIEARTSYAKVHAIEERYFAIFLTSYSRRADALVRSMSLLGQRLKDAMLA